MSSGEVKGNVLIDVVRLPCLDCGMRRVFVLTALVAVLAFLLGWSAMGEIASVFALLFLWLAAQFAVAPCCDEEPDDR